MTIIIGLVFCTNEQKKERKKNEISVMSLTTTSVTETKTMLNNNLCFLCQGVGGVEMVQGRDVSYNILGIGNSKTIIETEKNA